MYNIYKVLELRQYSSRSGKWTFIPERVRLGAEGTVPCEGEDPGITSDGDEGGRSESR